MAGRLCPFRDSGAQGRQLASALPLRAGGVFTSADGRSVGLSTKALLRLAHRGEVTRLCHGWWMPGHPADPWDRHRRLCAALHLHYAGHAWVSHTSALALAQLPVQSSALATAHLTRCTGQQARRATTYRMHASVGDLGPPAQLATAIVQSALLRGPLQGLYAADAALRRRDVTADDVAEALERLRGHRGMAQARAFLTHADGRHESPGETRTAVVLRSLGYAATPQVELRRDGTSYWVDFLLDDAPVVIEFDGRVKYTDPEVLFAEKRREDEIRSWGYVVVRLTWQLLAEPERVRQPIEDARALALRHIGEPSALVTKA